MTRPFNARILPGSFCGALIAAAALAACNSHTSPPPSPQARQQEAVEAQRKAASVEAEMNKDAGSEDIDKKPDGTPPQ
jgi:ABC-type enterochelin transport system substrate-binding protein